MAITNWQPPKDYQSRPVAILGAGVLGRRIACCWLSAGYDVTVRDPDLTTLDSCLEYIESEIHNYLQRDPSTNQIIRPGNITPYSDDISCAVQDAWLVIEAIPERLSLKIDTFAQLESIAPSDAILASNSSSYKTAEMLPKIKADKTKSRICNTHYYTPPRSMAVEIMTSGHTSPDLMFWLADRQREAGTKPYIARKESTGFIFNRLWAAVKREALMIMAEGVSVPHEIDELWDEILVKPGVGPCKMMDNAGLDTIALIEDHYVEERGLDSSLTSDFLWREYVNKGKLGKNSAKGGLYPPTVTSGSGKGKGQ
ncbi:NAD(P)-binding protein [Naviculisporaceae sp. PSN 640]